MDSAEPLDAAADEGSSDAPAPAPAPDAFVPPDVRERDAAPFLKPPPGPAALPAGDCRDVTDVQVTRRVEHLAAGQEITVRLAFTDGVPPAARDLRGCVRLDDPRGNRLPIAVERRTLGAAYTLLLVDPGANAEESQSAADSVRALLQRRLPADRVAIFRWGAAVTQMASFSTERPLLEARLVAGLGQAPVRAPLEAALAAASSAVNEIGSVAVDALRSIVVVSPRALEVPPARAVLDAAGAALLVWVGAGPPAGLPTGLRFPLGAAGVDGLSQRLEQYKTSAHLALGHCGTGEPIAAEIRLAGSMTGRSLSIPTSLEENRAGTCDFAALAAGKRELPRRIELLFTPEQRFTAALLRGTRMDFSFSVKISPQHVPVDAVAHYRGSSSFRCPRANYTLDLAGKEPRFLMTGSGESHFHLISLCVEDRLYLRVNTALQLLRDEGLFPIPFELVELWVDGATQGVYLLTENATAGLRQRASQVTAVVRRGFEGSTTTADVKWALGTPDDALASYQAILSGLGNLQDAALEAAARARLHVDQYLTWLAMASLFKLGDYVDEAYFVATNTTDAQGRPAPFFSIAAWDPSDIFMPCHNSGVNALPDPRELVYCSEAELDRRLLGDPGIYRRYVDILAALVERTPRARFEAALQGTRSKLLGFFADPKVMAAMIELRSLRALPAKGPGGDAGASNADAGLEPAPLPPLLFPDGIVTLEKVREAIDTDIADLLDSFAQNRDALLARIAAYRAGRP